MKLIIENIQTSDVTRDKESSGKFDFPITIKFDIKLDGEIIGNFDLCVESSTKSIKMSDSKRNHFHFIPKKRSSKDNPVLKTIPIADIVIKPKMPSIATMINTQYQPLPSDQSNQFHKNLIDQLQAVTCHLKKKKGLKTTPIQILQQRRLNIAPKPITTQNEEKNTIDLQIIKSNNDSMEKSKCVVCKKPVKNPDSINRLTSTFNVNKEVKCIKCITIFESTKLNNEKQKDLLRVNIGVKIPKPKIVKEFKCQECGKILMDGGSLLAHENAHKGITPFECEVCGKCFPGKNNLRMHLKIHRDEHSCQECGGIFTSKSDLIKHNRSAHQGTAPFECEVCGKHFPKKAHLRVHKRIHAKEFNCTECERSFALKSELTLHFQVTHQGIKSFQCNDCGKMFARKFTLQLHAATHSGIKPFHCERCDKYFSTEWHLKKHVRVHNGKIKKNHHCEHCDRYFVSGADLKDHKNSHTGNRPYECKACGKSFSRRDAFYTHKQSHNTIECFECQECGKSFTTKRKLTVHGYKHRTDKPFKCTVCGNCYTHNYILTKHIKQSHH